MRPFYFGCKEGDRGSRVLPEGGRTADSGGETRSVTTDEDVRGGFSTKRPVLSDLGDEWPAREGSGERVPTPVTRRNKRSTVNGDRLDGRPNHQILNRNRIRGFCPRGIVGGVWDLGGPGVCFPRPSPRTGLVQSPKTSDGLREERALPGGVEKVRKVNNVEVGLISPSQKEHDIKRDFSDRNEKKTKVKKEVRTRQKGFT